MRILLLAIASILITGCYVPNKSYRPAHDSLVQVLPTLTLPVKSPPPDGPFCTPESLLERPCLAFLELDEMGEKWSQDQGPVPDGETIDRSRATQLSNITQIIRTGVREDPKAVVITFTHGWKHNSKPGDANVDGFKEVLDTLHTELSKNERRVVIGIYISWRGELVSPYMPVRRNFTYFNREATATRIPGASLTNALLRIAAVTHRTDENTQAAQPSPMDHAQSVHPFLILVGHSFGGLIMERALTEAAVHQVTQCSVSGHATPGEPPQEVQPIADLVVFVNSAAAATEAKETLDLLASCHARYQAPAQPGASSRPDQPLLLSVSSSSDLATRVAMPIGHGLPFLEYKARGSLRDKDPLACFDPLSANPDSHFLSPEPSQGAFFMSTAAHMPILQSHVLVEEQDPAKRASCSVTNYPPGSAIFTYPLPGSGRCFVLQNKSQRCNGTPYWMMEIDGAIVPDHGTIFTDRFIKFLREFLPTEEQVRAGVHPQLTMQ